METFLVRRKAKKTPTPKGSGGNFVKPITSRDPKRLRKCSVRFSGFRIDLIPVPSHKIKCSG
tara:strand:- start:277 stop:462 length:186 start_codon:yes stop_codon:yes gene_type:complete